MSDFRSIWNGGSRLTSTERGERVLNKFADEREATKMQRRSVIKSLVGVGAATALAGCGTGGLPTPNFYASSPSVVQVLNFALNLEYFEASFYNYVATGTGLSASLIGSGAGTVSGGAQVSFVNPIVKAAAAQLATDETEHVQFLQSTITAVGGTPVPMPNINLAAGGAVSSDATFLAAARRFETVGVSAYAGGAPFLTSTTAGLTYAAQILDTEAQHEGFLRELCIALSVASPAVDALDIPPTSTTVFNTNSNGLVAARSFSQVLQILYATPGQAGVEAGGFFRAA